MMMQPEVRVNLPALEDAGGHAQVFHPAVGAAADDHLVDRDIANLADGPGVGWQVREGHLRLDLG